MPTVLVLCDSDFVLDLHKTGNQHNIASFVFITPLLMEFIVSVVIILSLLRSRELKPSVKLGKYVLVPEPREKEWVCGYVDIKKTKTKNCYCMGAMRTFC